MPKPTERVTFNNGTREVGAVVVGRHENGNLDLHAAEADSDQVVLFENIPQGDGGLEWHE